MHSQWAWSNQLCTVMFQSEWYVGIASLSSSSSSSSGLPWWLSGKGSTSNAGYLESIPGLGRSHGEGSGNPLQCSCLENPMDRGLQSLELQRVGQTEQLTLTNNNTWYFQGSCNMTKCFHSHDRQWFGVKNWSFPNDFMDNFKITYSFRLLP